MYIVQLTFLFILTIHNWPSYWFLISDRNFIKIKMQANIHRKTFDRIYFRQILSAQILRNKRYLCFSSNAISLYTVQNYVPVGHWLYNNRLPYVTKRNKIFTGKEEWYVFDKNLFVIALLNYRWKKLIWFPQYHACLLII